MTDEQGLAIFRVIVQMMRDYPKVARNSQLNIRRYFEPVIDEMLAEARAEGRREAQNKDKP